MYRAMRGTIACVRAELADDRRRRTIRLVRVAHAGAWVLLSGAAQADPADGPPGDAAAERVPPSHRVNLRIGLASSDQVQRPTVCLEVIAVRAISAEACGTGSGILHSQVGRQIAHFRLNVPLVRRATWGGWGSVRAGAGFAEMEVGEDRPGFDFGEPDQPGSTAGPDGALSIQWMRTIGKGFEVVGTGTIGLAWFSGADRLALPQDRFQPYASFELGVGW